MRSLSSLVVRRVLLSVALPMAALVAGLVAFDAYNLVQDVRGRTLAETMVQARAIGRQLQLEDRSWRRVFQGHLVPGETMHHPLVDSSICLLSVWRDDTLFASWPKGDIVPPNQGGSWSEVEAHPRCQDPVVRLRVDMGGGFAGQVVYRIGPLSRELAELVPIEARPEFVLVDSTGVPVMRSGPRIVDRVSDPDGRAAILAGVHQRLEWNPEALRAITAVRIPGTRWALVHRSTALGLVRQAIPGALFLMLLFAISIGAALEIGRGIGREVAVPLEDLAARLDAVAEKRWEVVPGSKALREIQLVEDAFGRMVEAIRHSEAEKAADLRHHAFQLERRGRELEAAMAELESFSYSVSHDLRAPLRAIDGFSLALEEDAADRLGEEERSHLSRIRKAAGRMGDLIDDLLSLSRASRTPLTRTRIDMDEMVREIVADLEAAEPDRRVAFSALDLGTARVDPSLWRQVWTNLLSNAWKFTSRVESPRVELRSVVEGADRVWILSDNGAGFEPSQAGRLFEPFRRLHSVEEYPGTGIGLALVRRVVARHGGVIEGTGRPGHGATFQVFLPLD